MMSKLVNDNYGALCTNCCEGIYGFVGSEQDYVKCTECGIITKRLTPYEQEKKTDILDLLKEYEMTNDIEGPNEVEWLVNMTLRLMKGLEDGQDKAIMWKMARYLDEDYKLDIIHPDYK